MDVRERIHDPIETALAGMDARQVSMWTALPCIVQSFDPVAMTVTAQPAIQGAVLNAQTGATDHVNLPLLVDVPVCWMGGGGVTATFPIAPGDEALVVFASRCIDGWWQSGGVQRAMDARAHDLSDGFALVGVRSQARKIPGISTTAAQMRTDDGANFVEVSAAGLRLVAGGTVLSITAAGIDIVSPHVVHNDKHIDASHIHGGVQSGGGTTSVPAN